jgi:hypothetical protein
MTDIRDHRSSVQPQRVNGKLPIRPVNYLQVTAPRHGRRATLRSAVPARLPTAAARARQVSGLPLWRRICSFAWGPPHRSRACKRPSLTET